MVIAPTHPQPEEREEKATMPLTRSTAVQLRYRYTGTMMLRPPGIARKDSCCISLRHQALVGLQILLASTSSSWQPSPPRPIKLMTYNIHAWRDSFHRCNFDRIVQVVNEVQPDILCLNEALHPFARPPSPSKKIDEYYERVQNKQGQGHPVNPALIAANEKLSFLHQLGEKIGLTTLDFVEATDNSYFGQGVSFGNAILTCHTIVESCHVLMEVEEGEEDLGNQRRDFADPRSFGAAIIEIDNQHRIGVAYGHLDHKSEQLREKQILMQMNPSDQWGEAHLSWQWGYT